MVVAVAMETNSRFAHCRIEIEMGLSAKHLTYPQIADLPSIFPQVDRGIHLCKTFVGKQVEQRNTYPLLHLHFRISLCHYLVTDL